MTKDSGLWKATCIIPLTLVKGNRKNSLLFPSSLDEMECATLFYFHFLSLTNQTHFLIHPFGDTFLTHLISSSSLSLFLSFDVINEGCNRWERRMMWSRMKTDERGVDVLCSNTVRCLILSPFWVRDASIFHPRRRKLIITRQQPFRLRKEEENVMMKGRRWDGRRRDGKRDERDEMMII